MFFRGQRDFCLFTLISYFVGGGGIFFLHNVLLCNFLFHGMKKRQTSILYNRYSMVQQIAGSFCSILIFSIIPLCSNPFCTWFWSGFWVPKHLLKRYLEH